MEEDTRRAHALAPLGEYLLAPENNSELLCTSILKGYTLITSYLRTIQ